LLVSLVGSSLILGVRKCLEPRAIQAISCNRHALTIIEHSMAASVTTKLLHVRLHHCKLRQKRDQSDSM